MDDTRVCSFNSETNRLTITNAFIVELGYSGVISLRIEGFLNPGRINKPVIAQRKSSHLLYFVDQHWIGDDV